MVTKRYFHIRLPNKPAKGGATMLVKSTDDPHKVKVQVALCHPDDAFWRGMGRLVAQTKQPKTVRVQELPELCWDILGSVYEKTTGDADWPTDSTAFDYVKRHFTPKVEVVGHEA